MRNKKGDLLNNVLGLIIAAIGIGLLIFGAVKLYGATESQEEEGAKNILTVISEKINNLKDGETGKYPVQGIEEWFLTGWNASDLTRPDKCFFKSCICVCKKLSVSYYASDKVKLKEDCQKNGFCKEIDKEDIRINGGGVYIVGEDRDKISYRDFILFQKNLIELEIRKEKESLYILTEG